VLHQSFDVIWGGIEMVYATLESIFALLDISDKWEFVINLSSTDYPLCTDEELSTYLGTRKGSNFDVAQIPPTEDEKYW
jgi:Core-2/I-Branching enzyme